MNRHQMKILIVDDERSNLEVLSRILQPKQDENIAAPIHSDYSLCIAKSGQAALKKVTEEKPDLILLDVIMPDMDGFEVLSVLKNSEITRDIPVIFITGLNSVEYEEKGFMLGAVDYITKPFHNSLVRARVRTHLRIAEQMRIIENLGMIDTLTGIPNRRAFNRRISMEWNRAIRDKSTVSVLMLDLDFFKSFNDRYGHKQGDTVLKSVASVLTASLKRPADFAARWGGEEFAVILPDTNIKGAISIAETIRANVEKSLIPNPQGIRMSVTVSIGAASAKPEIDSEINELIEQADKAMYAAKESGRNKVCRFLTENNKNVYQTE